MQELAAEPQAGRVAVKQSSLTKTASVGHELSTSVSESPQKPPVLTLDLSSTESATGLTDTGAQQSQS